MARVRIRLNPYEMHRAMRIPLETASQPRRTPPTILARPSRQVPAWKSAKLSQRNVAWSIGPHTASRKGKVAYRKQRAPGELKHISTIEAIGLMPHTV